uniref:Uncharacterized protein n=1 Tax=Zooxanthella nutricula TaxID=1333877 RepID=A0A6V0FLP8_9DINO|mmetsp:Transcript_100718/g.307892  ORF Transcript_100718/g.307892 Transcript_100718/m.307892 type:complete len:389 (+) Transcript_100718:95-1261(+)
MADLENGQLLEVGGRNPHTARAELPLCFSRWWCLLPIGVGACYCTIGVRQDWAVWCFGDLLPVRQSQIIMMFTAICSIGHALPAYFVVAICESDEFQAMVRSASAGNPHYLDKLVADVKWLWWKPARNCCFTCFATGLLGYAAFQTVQAGLVFAALGIIGAFSRFESRLLELMHKMCHQEVSNFIALMIPTVPEDSDKAQADKSVSHFRKSPKWQAVSAAHSEMDRRMDDLWAPHLGSALLALAVLLRFAEGLGTLVIGVVLEDTKAKVCAWTFGVWLTRSALSNFVRPAGLTTRCVSGNPRFGLTAIPVVVNGFACHCDMTQEEKTGFLMFTAYLQQTVTGVELFGVLVTPALVSQLSAGLLTHVPIAIGLLQSFISSERVHSSHHD